MANRSRREFSFNRATSFSLQPSYFALAVQSCVGEELTNVGTIHEDTYDHALAMVQLERLISDRAVTPFFQPIVGLEDPSLPLVAYEVLGRSHLYGLSSPTEMFRTASQLNLETELSRVFRSQGLEIAQAFDMTTALFVNTHPAELHAPGLLASLEELRANAAERPLVLEIHEAAVTNPEMIRSLRDGLNEHQVQLAFDDFGAGQARLLELADVRPDYIKFDMKLIQGIHQAPASRQQVVALLVHMVNELDITPVAEGVETAEDHATLCQMGMRLGQGYYYGRPGSLADYSVWDGPALNQIDSTSIQTSIPLTRCLTSGLTLHARRPCRWRPIGNTQPWHRYPQLTVRTGARPTVAATGAFWLSHPISRYTSVARRSKGDLSTSPLAAWHCTSKMPAVLWLDRS